MIRIIKNLNTVKYVYNTLDNGVKTLTKPYIKPMIKETTSDDYDFVSVDGKTNYIKSTDDGVYPYECFKETHGYDKGFYFNSMLEFPHDQLEILDFPKHVFYDIETSDNSLPAKVTNNGINYLQAPKTAIVNSVAWVTEDGEKYCLIRGRDGSEFDILDEFVNYLESNDISCLISHNGANFDDIIMRDRLLHHGLNHELFSKTKNQLNLDTLKLAQLLNIVPKSKMISLNDLASELGLDMQKDDLEVLNPITAYNESVKNNDYTKFESYNLQDVVICKSCFERMGAKDVLMELFKQTLAPFSKFNSNVALLNHYTCNKLLKDGFVVPKINNPTLQTKNEGGYNFIKESDKLLKYDSVVAYDIVSYYPSLFMLVGADSNGVYDNFNTTTGELSVFSDDLPKGLLSEIAEDLFNSRIETKKLMKSESDELKKSQLNNKQLTQKILVNSLYGACDSSYNYILGSHKVSTMITAIGRDLLKAVIDEFDACYGKTDSIFISDVSNPNKLLLDINKFVSKYLKDRFNLNNIRDDGSSIIKFEIDSVLKSLIVKSANEYIKIYDDGTIKLKGGSFKGDNKSDFESDLIQFVLSDNGFSIDNVFKFCGSVINDKPLSYFSKKQKLSSKTPNSALCLGREYMEDNNIPYSWDFKYNAVRVDSDKYDWVLYPNGVNTGDLKISRYYVYIIAIMYLKTNKLITKTVQQGLFKNKDLFGNGISINAYNRNKKKQLSDIDGGEVLNITHIDNDINCDKVTELCSLIKDTKEYIDKDIIKIVPLDKERITDFDKIKEYLGISSFKYSTNIIKKIPSAILCDVDSNIGVALNYNDLHIFDIDGSKGISKEDNKKLCDYLKDLLVSTGINFIIQTGKTKGYHLYFVGDNNINFANFKYPKDFFIENLRDKYMTSSTIEVLNNRFTPLAPTETSEGSYEFISNDYTWKSIFDNPSNDTFKVIHDTLIENGFTYDKPTQNKQDYYYNYGINELIDLNTEQIGNVVNAMIDLELLANRENSEGHTCKYHVNQAFGGICSRYISYESAEIIASNLWDNVGSLTDHGKDKFMYDILKSYDKSEGEDLTGIPTIEKFLITDDNESKKKVNACISEIMYNFMNYVPRDVGSYRQEYNKFTYDNKIIGYFNIRKIDIIDGFNPVNQKLNDDLPTKYDFLITCNRFKTPVKYSNITIDGLFNKLNNLDVVKVYKDEFKKEIREFIYLCSKKKYINAITRPYNNGVFVFKDEILINLDYLNTVNTLEEGLEILDELINDVFLNREEYIAVLNQIMLNMLSSVFKSLHIAQNVNKTVLLTGKGATLKTYVILVGEGLFDYNTDLMESSGATSFSSIYRLSAEDTLPLGLHDSDISVSDTDFKQYIKRSTFGFEIDSKAKEQYGNDVNKRYGFRLLNVTTNEPYKDFNIQKDDGEDRRLAIIYFDDSFIVNEEQNEAIQKLFCNDENNPLKLRLHRISSIGYYWLKYIQKTIKPFDMNFETRKNILDTNGYCLINGFWHEVDKITNGVYSNLIDKMTNDYEFKDYTIDWNSEIIELLRKNFEEYNSNKQFDNDNQITNWIETNTVLFKKPVDTKAYNGKYGVSAKEFKNIVRGVKSNSTHDKLFNNLFPNGFSGVMKRYNKKHFGIENVGIVSFNDIKKYMLGVDT